MLNPGMYRQCFCIYMYVAHFESKMYFKVLANGTFIQTRDLTAGSSKTPMWFMTLMFASWVTLNMLLDLSEPWLSVLWNLLARCKGELRCIDITMCVHITVCVILLCVHRPSYGY